MKDWIPFLQSLIWPLLIIVFLLLTKKRVIALLDAVVDRVKKGDSIQAGPFGMGQSIPQDAYSKKDTASAESTKLDVYDKFSYGAYPEMPPEIRKVRVVRLSHKIGPWGKDRDDYTRRDVIVTLETSPDTLLDCIDKVTYYLPDSWPKKLRIQDKYDRSDYFELKTRAYGEVTVGAKVEFNDGTSPLILNRYCNFYE